MTVRVIRELSVDDATMGVVFVNDRFLCFSLEDTIRERAGQPVSAWKVPGGTAIPAGRYRLAMTWSPRFNRVMPEVVDVPGFTGVRIHAGNSVRDTEGCLLFGLRRSGALVLDSGAAIASFVPALEASLKSEPAWIVLENPLSYSA